MVISTGNFKDLGLTPGGSIQAQLLTAIARSAEELTNGRGWPDGVNELLSDLGRITGVSRVWIFQTLELTVNSILQDYTFEWASAPEHVQIGLPHFNRFKTKIDQPGYRQMIESRKKGEYQKVLTNKLPPSWLRSNQERQNILSMLTIPITVEGKWWGTLGFDDCEREYNWSDAEIALLRTAGFLISSAVLRDSLSAKRKQLDILKKITACSAWHYDLKRRHIWCTSDIFTTTPGKTQNFQFSFKDFLKMIHQADYAKFIKAIREFDFSSGRKFRCDLRMTKECGEFRWVELIGSMELDSRNNQTQMAGIATDITTRKEAEERLRHEASTDPLTGVVNRRRIELRIQEQIDLFLQAGISFSLIMLDLDHFKHINDTFGHATGDRILTHFARTVEQCLRKKDTLARVGGEEFALLLPGTQEADALVIGNRIRTALKKNPYAADQPPIPVTVSMGCAMINESIASTIKIYTAADSALYRAKRSGRDRIIVAGPDCDIILKNQD